MSPPEPRRHGDGDETPKIPVRRDVSSPVAAYTPFPHEVLPGPVRQIIETGAAAMGCDTSYIALPIISALAAAIGNTRRIQLLRIWTEPSIVWTAIVGESGTAKSPAMELALRPIRKRQHEAMREHAEAMKEHADEMALFEREAAAWKRSKSDTLPPAKPDTPTAARCWTDDATTEALAALLQQNPRGLLMARDELAAWFAFDRYSGGKGGGDVAKWLEMHGGRAMVVDRKGGGTLYVPRASVSIAGGIQPGILARALGQEYRDNGLAARILFAMPPRRAKKWSEADVDPRDEAAVAEVFGNLFALLPEPDDDGGDRPQVLTLSDDAKAAWVTFYEEHATEQAELSGDLSAAWSKLEGYAARLALVVHMTRWASDDPQVPTSTTPVDAQSVAAGVALSRWFGGEARRVYAALADPDGERGALDWIAARGGTCTVRDLTRGPREYRGDPDKAAKALAALVAEGLAEWVHEGAHVGRPAERVRLVSRRGDTGDGDETPKIPVRHEVSSPRRHVASVDAWDDGVPIIPPGDLAG
ncbi:MAG: DUF3987 domain-containing protein [Phycisphaeraceae bacterium]|nr:DUF3987 domain-containing protein [Phycisphaeraceae bacterium]